MGFNMSRGMSPFEGDRGMTRQNLKLRRIRLRIIFYE
jgi:hypothetical protein